MGVFYRPPNSNLTVLEDLQNSLSNITTTDIVLLGDFNLSEIDWANNRSLRNSEHHILLSDIIQDNFMHQLVNEPTRDQNILDLVLTTNVDLINNVVVGEHFSDHNSITFTLNCAPYLSRISKKFIYAFNKADWSHLRSLFQNTPWDFVLSDQDIDDNWIKWKDIFFTAVDDCIPKYRQKKRITAPWITKDLIKLCRKKENLYKRAKRSGRQETWADYRNLNNLLKKKCNSAKWQHLKELADKLKLDNNSKPFWNYIKSMRKGTNDLVLLKDGRNEITDEQSIAQEMNLYFSSVFTREQSDLPEFDNMIYDNLSHIFCTSSEVEKHLKALNIHKSPGPDLISPHILKECALELSTSLCVLFNKSFSTGMLPADWKIANITPIHKKGNKHKKGNYRQISLTSIVCKIAEKIVRSRITTFWSTHHVLNPNQFGYLEGKSTLAQLLSCFHDWCLSTISDKSPWDTLRQIAFSLSFDTYAILLPSHHVKHPPLPPKSISVG